MIARANSSCTDPAKPRDLTLAYTLSVLENWPQRNQGQDNLGTQARMPALSLEGVTGAIPTGLRLHRNIFVCSSFDVALASGTPSYVKLRKYQTNGTADGAAARSLTGVAMPGSGAADRHVRDRDRRRHELHAADDLAHHDDHVDQQLLRQPVGRAGLA